MTRVTEADREKFRNFKFDTSGYIEMPDTRQPQWQPIETAPMDGTEVILGHRDWGSVKTGYWSFFNVEDAGYGTHPKEAQEDLKNTLERPGPYDDDPSDSYPFDENWRNGWGWSCGDAEGIFYPQPTHWQSFPEPLSNESDDV